MNHRQLAIARRVKFIFEKAGFISFAFDTHKGRNKKKIISLFPAKQGKEFRLNLIKSIALFFDKNIARLVSVKSQEEYDKAFYHFINDFRNFLVKRKLCNDFSTDNYLFWSYFTKTSNILLYDILTSNEVIETQKFLSVRDFMHAPIDKKIINEIQDRISKCNMDDKGKIISKLKYYNKLNKIDSQEDYIYIQGVIRKVQKLFSEPAIWIEDAYILS